MTEAEFQELLLKLIMNDPKVTEVNFGGRSEVYDLKHALYLINALAFNTKCKSLMFCDINLGLEGAAAISRLIETNTGIKTLKIFNVMQEEAFLGIEGVGRILDAFKNNSKTRIAMFKLSDKCYDLQDNDKLIDLFTNMLKVNNTLTFVDFSGCRISAPAFKRFVDTIKTENKKLWIANIDDNDHVNKIDPVVISEKEVLEKLLSRNARLRNVRQAATMMAQASRDPNCVLNCLPPELLPVIAGLTSGYNKIRMQGYGFHPFNLFSFTPEEESMEDVLADAEAYQKYTSENARMGR